VSVRRFFNYLIFSAFGLTLACTSDPERHISDAEYLPLQKGVYQIYDVDSTWYTALDDEQTIHFQLLTQVVDSFINTENNFTYVIYRYKRSDDSEPWKYSDTWSSRVNNIRAVVSEQNQEFVKFVLPVSEGRKWDGNAFNGGDVDEYEMINTRKPYTVNDKLYDDCIEVNQNFDDDPIVRTDIRREVYARDVGLILKEITILDFCTVGCTVFGEIETGIVYSQRLKEYGVQ
jgi:hypothetical protein